MQQQHATTVPPLSLSLPPTCALQHFTEYSPNNVRYMQAADSRTISFCCFLFWHCRKNERIVTCNMPHATYILQGHLTFGFGAATSWGGRGRGRREAHGGCCFFYLILAVLTAFLVAFLRKGRGVGVWQRCGNCHVLFLPLGCQLIKRNKSQQARNGTCLASLH